MSIHSSSSEIINCVISAWDNLDILVVLPHVAFHFARQVDFIFLQKSDLGSDYYTITTFWPNVAAILAIAFSFFICHESPDI